MCVTVRVHMCAPQRQGDWNAGFSVHAPESGLWAERNPVYPAGLGAQFWLCSIWGTGGRVSWPLRVLMGPACPGLLGAQTPGRWHVCRIRWAGALTFPCSSRASSGTRFRLTLSPRLSLWALPSLLGGSIHDLPHPHRAPVSHTSPHLCRGTELEAISVSLGRGK